MRYAAAGVAALLLLAFAWFVWPTLYWYSVPSKAGDAAVVVRVNRVTGNVCWGVGPPRHDWFDGWFCPWLSESQQEGGESTSENQQPPGERLRRPRLQREEQERQTGDALRRRLDTMKSPRERALLKLRGLRLP